MTGLIGSYVDVPRLRETNVSDLQWKYDSASEAWWVRDGDGITASYITREMVELTIFTPESILANWIWRVSSWCIGGPTDPEPDFVQK